MSLLQKPQVLQALPLYPRGGGPPLFKMRLPHDEYGMSRGMKKVPYAVILTPKVWDIIQKSLPMRNGDTATEVVYAWDMLRRNRLLARFEDILETANEIGEGIMDIVVGEINLLKKLSGQE